MEASPFARRAAPAFPQVALALLSWKSPKTLAATLRALADADVFSLFGERLIYFQEVSEEDRQTAARYNLPAAGGATNLGIRGGMEAIANLCKAPFVLHLENDMRLVTSGEHLRRQTATALQNIAAGRAHYYGLQARAKTDDKLLRYHPLAEAGEPDTPARKLRRLLRPRKARRLLGRYANVAAAPHLLAPRVVRQLGNGHWAADSSAYNWSNRAPLYPREWFLQTILPFAKTRRLSRFVNGKPDLEKELNCAWWRRSRFSVGVCDGAFAHTRLDRPQNDEKALRAQAAGNLR